MKSSIKHNAQGKLRQFKGRILEAAGKIFGIGFLESEGRLEHLNGTIQVKQGWVERMTEKMMIVESNHPDS